MSKFGDAVNSILGSNKTSSSVTTTMPAPMANTTTFLIIIGIVGLLFIILVSAHGEKPKS